jgi:hypothetical protein
MNQTFNRGKLKRLAAAGLLEMVGSYSFDDMVGEERTGSEKIIPVVYPRPLDWKDRHEGTVYLDDHDFSSASGLCWKNPNGTIHLKIHSNLNYTFRIKALNGPLNPCSQIYSGADGKTRIS